jgi:hypothetical protein
MPPKKKNDKPENVAHLLGRPGNKVKMGILGLPNVGKSALFNVLAKLQVSGCAPPHFHFRRRLHTLNQHHLTTSTQPTLSTTHEHRCRRRTIPSAQSTRTSLIPRYVEAVVTCVRRRAPPPATRTSHALATRSPFYLLAHSHTSLYFCVTASACRFPTSVATS